MVHTQKTAQGIDGTQLWRVMPLVHRPYPLLVFLYRKEDVKTSISHQAGPLAWQKDNSRLHGFRTGQLAWQTGKEVLCGLRRADRRRVEVQPFVELKNRLARRQALPVG
jgi:hypothetical protein